METQGTFSHHKNFLGCNHLVWIFKIYPVYGTDSSHLINQPVNWSLYRMCISAQGTVETKRMWIPDHLVKAGSVSHVLLDHRIPLSAGQGILITLTVQQFLGENTVFL